ncbi:MAG TPA: ribonuclease Y [Sedimentisphaerales bacterium]|nr:ribonuclease Y [Sedimentisphaerales bacterium]HRS09904.1 ribonuclease Y [Sedimentisphaerales bacterium]HRV46446.1 ribonuclease Y [Sedimentisphaerales bacterium]
MDAILMQVTLQAGIACVFSFILGICLTVFVYSVISRARARQRAEDAARQIDAANREAENIIKAAQIEAAAEAIKKKEQFTAEANQIRAELRENEMRLSKREDALERQTELLQKQEQALKKQEQDVERRLRNTELKDKQLSVLIAQQKNQLLKITAMDVEEARQLLLKRLEDECEHEMASLIQRKVEEAQEIADSKSREILSTAIQRYAAEQTCEVTVSTVEIPNDDMKGRIIGREGRNIRAFEKATGVDVIVDDTPGMVVVSGFNPVRREVARLSMERLIQDGRIHPSRIEELVAQTRNEVNAKVLQLGKDAAVETNVRGLPNKIISLLGALAYRTSYGQNVLRHSVEVAFLSQVMADELGLDGSIARRAGLLHDIGKAIDHDVEGSHPAIGTNYLKRFNESPIVLNAVAGHHGDVPPDNPYTPLVAAADAISASRPGARRETLERYIKRLEKLEEIATGFKGVETAYAIQAGREIRVIANANEVDDEAAMKIARDIAKKVEDEMTYPGEIQITLLREVRCIEYAR